MKAKAKKAKRAQQKKDQDLKILLEDIASHRQEVREIEALTFQQLMGVQKRVAAELAKKHKVRTMDEDSEEDSPEEE
ncbi:MAG TPA: hypothetical protein VJC16_03255 [Candidatus Nanoarchaeia archaeon]|nr:hypothetical protein [Candidatus Nanoarchaeia archaeon]